MDKQSVKSVLTTEGYLFADLIAPDVVKCLQSFNRFKGSFREIAYPPAFCEKDKLYCVSGVVQTSGLDESLRVIPVCVYLRKNYPAVPPMCFVGEDGPSRTKLMTETVNVDRHGRVHSIPFVDEWKFTNSLTVLLNTLVKSFGENPPPPHVSNMGPYLPPYTTSTHLPTQSYVAPSSTGRWISPRHSASLPSLSQVHPYVPPIPKDYGNEAQATGNSNLYSPPKSLSMSLPASHASLRQQNSGNKEIASDRVMQPLQQRHGQAWSHSQRQQQIPTVTEAPTSSLYTPPVQIPRHNFQAEPMLFQRKDSIDEADDHNEQGAVISKLVAKEFEKFNAGLQKKVDGLEEGTQQMQEELAAEKKQNESLKQKMKELEENLTRMQQELDSTKAITLLLKTSVIPSLVEKIDTLENSLQSAEQMWVISREEIQFTQNILGAGGWGIVKEALYRGRKVAAKCLHDAIVSPHNREKFEKEMRISAFCKHCNLVEFIGAVLDHPAVILIEIMDRSLRSALANGDVVPDTSKPIYMDVARALHYLHNLQPHPVIHRDVSAPNVLLRVCETVEGGWIAKISDFGSAQFAHLAQTPGPGCILYSAPEVRGDKPGKQTVKIDIYSYGVLLTEILTAIVPNDDLASILQNLDSKKPQFMALVHRCTNDDPDLRPGIDEVIPELEIINLHN